MQTLHIQLIEIEQNCVELRYLVSRGSQYESQVLNMRAIQDLIKQAKLNYYLGQQPKLAGIGQRLFFWLDGEGRWFSRAIAHCPCNGLILAIDTGKKLAHLPWEVLHNGSDFLVNWVNPVIVPIRWIDRPTKARSIQDDL